MVEVGWMWKMVASRGGRGNDRWRAKGGGRELALIPCWSKLKRKTNVKKLKFLGFTHYYYKIILMGMSSGSSLLT